MIGHRSDAGGTLVETTGGETAEAISDMSVWVHIRDALAALEVLTYEKNCRELSIVKTKLQEAKFWYDAFLVENGGKNVGQEAE